MLGSQCTLPTRVVVVVVVVESNAKLLEDLKELELGDEQHYGIHTLGEEPQRLTVTAKLRQCGGWRQ